MSTPRSGSPADRLQALLEPVVAAAGYDLEAVRVSQVARRRRVEVVVDGDDGVSLDAVSDITRVVSDVLDGPDGAEVMGEQPYVLEVGSPGTDRPLTLPKHWRRAKGRLVRAVLRDGGEAAGRILDSDEDGVLLEVEVPGKKKGQPPTVQERRLTFAEVAKARVEIEFNRKDDDTGAADGVEDIDDVEDAEDAEDELDDIDEDEEG
jgi:ribosome maturation factor RimP